MDRRRGYRDCWFAVVLCFAAHSGFSQTRYTVSDEDVSGPGSPQLVVLRDAGGFEAAVAPSRGGELSSFRVKFKGQWIELLYRARDYSNPIGFQGKAAILWPAAEVQFPLGPFPKTTRGEGSGPGDSKTDPMPRDGFGSSLPWIEVSRSADNQGAQVTVELRDSGSTRKFYPFGFTLDATYRLSGGQLTIDYKVSASPDNKQSMNFSIGNRVAFKLPLVPGSNPAATTFESHSMTQLLRNSSGFFNGKEKARSFETQESLGNFDAALGLPLAGYLDAQPYAVLRDPQGLSVRVMQQTLLRVPEPVVRFNVSGGPQQGYLCPEPWFGITNFRNLGKPPVHLAAGTSWIWRVQIKPTGLPPDSPMSAGVERFGGGFGYVEGPVWSRKGYLLFSDMLQSQIFKMTRPNHADVFRDDTSGSNGNTMDVQGRLYSCERDVRRVVRLESNAHLTVIASEYRGKRLNDPNDIVVRRDGQVYFSDSLPKGSLQHFDLDYAGVYHVTPKGKISLVAKMAQPNGVTLTPDGRTLLVADTAERKIVAFDLDAEGNASHPRVLISGIDGGPDGLRVAANGNIYIACRGIAIYTPEGKFIRMIEFPETPANCTFGDSDLHTLYVTARTSVYRVRIADQGYLVYGN